MTDGEEARHYVNRWGDTSAPAPERRGLRREACWCFDQSRTPLAAGRSPEM
ncbi:hypothetical protein OG247_41550 [Streptomyces sp. NBC_01244]|nr:hypothetical protein OG247_41550 [Streptomyces sp. NBC_01244]